MSGTIVGKWWKDDLNRLVASAKHTEWPWTTRKIHLLAKRLNMEPARVEYRLRKMRIGSLMRCSSCDYCALKQKRLDLGFCARGFHMDWKNCGIANAERQRPDGAGRTP